MIDFGGLRSLILEGLGLVLRLRIGLVRVLEGFEIRSRTCMRNMTENVVKRAEPAAGVMGSGKEDLGQELEIKSQHATPPFRWKGAADPQGFAPAAGPLSYLVISANV